MEKKHRFIYQKRRKREWYHSNRERSQYRLSGACDHYMSLTEGDGRLGMGDETVRVSFQVQVKVYKDTWPHHVGTRDRCIILTERRRLALSMLSMLSMLSFLAGNSKGLVHGRGFMLGSMVGTSTCLLIEGCMSLMNKASRMISLVLSLSLARIDVFSSNIFLVILCWCFY